MQTYDRNEYSSQAAILNTIEDCVPRIKKLISMENEGNIYLLHGLMTLCIKAMIEKLLELSDNKESKQSIYVVSTQVLSRSRCLPACCVGSSYFAINRSSSRKGKQAYEGAKRGHLGFFQT